MFHLHIILWSKRSKVHPYSVQSLEALNKDRKETDGWLVASEGKKYEHIDIALCLNQCRPYTVISLRKKHWNLRNIDKISKKNSTISITLFRLIKEIFNFVGSTVMKYYIILYWHHPQIKQIITLVLELAKIRFIFHNYALMYKD